MKKTKRKNYFAELAMKNIHYFIGFIVLAYLLSQIVVQGSTMISDAIDTMTAGADVPILPLVQMTLVLIAVSMVLAFGKIICGELFSIRIQKECRNITVQTLSKLEYSYFTDSAGAVITKLTSDIGEIGTLFSENLPCIVQYVVTIVTMCVSIFFINRSLLFGLLITYPVVLLITDFIARKLVALTKARKGNYDALAEVANDGLQGMVVGRSYHLYAPLNERINQVGKTILKNEYMRNRWGAFSTITENLIKWMPMVICSLIALTQVFEGKLTVGGLTAFVILFNKISSQMGELPFIINESRELMVSVQRLNGILNEPQEPSGTYCGEKVQQERAVWQESAAQQSGGAVMELCDVGFWYEEAPEYKIFEHLNLSIEQGKTTAIVGPSGAGKSTIFKLFCGFARPKEGVLNLYGTDFNEWDLAAARERISLVSQNVFLFPDTIRANVEFGRAGASFEAVIEACKAARIHDYIMSLPQQYDTIVGERGANLSGGEKQRISIARALLKNAPVMLLDEPTSALDVATEEAIQTALNNISKAVTVVIIAHRLSTIVHADRIVVLDCGKVAESGTHEELLQLDGVYAGLYRHSSKSAESESEGVGIDEE